MEMNSPDLIRHKHTRAGSLIRADHRRRLLAAAAAEDDPLRRAPSRKARRVAPPTSMVRRQKHITVVRRLGHHIINSRRFQITRQQDAATHVLNSERHTIGVIAADYAVP